MPGSSAAGTNLQHTFVRSYAPPNAGVAPQFNQNNVLTNGSFNAGGNRNRKNFERAVQRMLQQTKGSDRRKLTLKIGLDQVMQRGEGPSARIVSQKGKTFNAGLKDIKRKPFLLTRGKYNRRLKSGVLSKTAVNARRQLYDDLWENVMQIVTMANERYIGKESNGDTHLGWEFSGITITSYDQMPIGGSGYEPLPKGLQGRYCMFNPRVAEHCFQYCVAAHLHPSRYKGRLSEYKRHLKPGPAMMSLQKIPAFERLHNVKINVYGVTPNSGKSGYFPYLVYPHDERAAKRDMSKVIPLVLYKNHYSLITNFNQFAVGDCRKGLHVCGSCMQQIEPGVSHAETCSKFPPMVMSPSPTKFLEYKEMPSPKCVIVADFESMLTADKAHVPCAWCLKVLGGQLHEGFGPNSVKDFIECVMDYSSELTVCAFHNLRGYDSHLIIKYLANSMEHPYELEILPSSEEKVIGFTLRKSRYDLVRFIDSYALMPQALDRLLQNAGKEVKLFYPYEYFDCWEKYEETEMPPIESFYSSLREESISEEDHASAVDLMKSCRDLKEYTMLYIRRDVEGLDEVLTEFRRLTYETYGVDCCGFWSSPGVSWAAMLRFTQVKIETVPPDMYMWLESGVRGGISVISKHRATATEDSCITYFDANNLYGWAMSEKLPIDNYRFVSEWIKDPTDQEAHILEVDLHYPEALHHVAAHQQYPLGVEAVTCEDKTKKLCGTFKDKKHYVVHERMLDYFLSKGLVITKIHRILRFRQEAWLKPYIEKNSKLRALAPNDFESELYKLMNNSVFGKTLESPRNRCAMRLFEAKGDKFKRFASQPLFVSARELGERYILANAMRTKMVCNKVPAVGVTILDLSKLHMAKWHYDVVMERMPQAQLCATDTDSFFYHIPGFKEDQVFEMLQDTLDTSNFPVTHPLYDSSRKKVPGYFKSEVKPPERIEDAIWLRAKMYSYKTDKKEEIKAKGIVKKYVSKHMRHEQFVECFSSREDLITKPFCKFVSKKHDLKTETFTKVGLSCFDDKRIQLDEVYTLPHGISASAKDEFIAKTSHL